MFAADRLFSGKAYKLGDLIVVFYSNRSQKSDLKMQKFTQILVRGAVMKTKSQKNNVAI